MEKTLVSVNFPNFITINLMAWLGILIVILIYHSVMKRKASDPANNSAGY